MLSEYLNQTITWKSKSTIDKYNQSTFTSSSISGRFIYKRQLIRLPNNEEVVSDAILYTESQVLEGDVINYDSKDWLVRNVYPHVYLDGSKMGYKVVL